MAYVRNHGNQLAIVHGERDPETGKVDQRVLFTICSKPEAQAVLDKKGEGRGLEHMLEQRYPRIRFDWPRIRAGIEKRMGSLPDIYPYRTGEVLGRFREDLCAFTRQIGHADPQMAISAAEAIKAHRLELEYLQDLIEWRLRLCDQEPNEFNRDNDFFWRHRLQPEGIPIDDMERISELWDQRELERVEALARLFIDCYDDYAEGHNYLGLVALEREQIEEAADHFRRAMEVGRRLFPKRLAKKWYWADHDTRPYMRAMRNLTITLFRSDRYDEALELCERMTRECGDDLAATTFRACIYLNSGRWAEAREAASRLVEIWPEHSYIVAFAAYEEGDREEAAASFVHGVLNRPRTGRMLLNMRTSEPKELDQVRDHNQGVDERKNLRSYLSRQTRGARRFFTAIVKSPDTAELLEELETVTGRWRSRSDHDRKSFTRMQEMQTISFARTIAPRMSLGA